MVYKNISQLLSNNNETTNESTYNKAHIINTNIISFKMNNDDIEQLKEEPIQLVFKHIHHTSGVSKPTCTYWSYDTQTFKGGKWMTDGCKLNFTNTTHTICSCTHLTHFAVLMDINGLFDTYNPLMDTHNKLLKIITIILSTLSIMSLLITLLAFRYIKYIKKNRDNSLATKDLTRITMHLCTCLIISLIVFLAGVLLKDTMNKSYCIIIGILTHYLFLCDFFWMSLEGVQLYLMLVKIFLLDKSPLVKFCCIAYGIPFIIVCTSVSINFLVFDEPLGYATSQHCWLSSHKHFNLFFILPITFILFMNLSILFKVIFKMNKTLSRGGTSNTTSTSNSSRRQDKFYKSLMTFWCLIVTLLGIPWIIGYFITLDDVHSKNGLLFSYLFTIVNSSQGIIIFIFHCIISKIVRNELLRLIVGKFNRDNAKNGKSKRDKQRSSSLIKRDSSNSSSFKSKLVKNNTSSSSSCAGGGGGGDSGTGEGGRSSRPSSTNTQSKQRDENSFMNNLFRAFNCLLPSASSNLRLTPSNQNEKTHSTKTSCNSDHQKNIRVMLCPLQSLDKSNAYMQPLNFSGVTSIKSACISNYSSTSTSPPPPPYINTVSSHPPHSQQQQSQYLQLRYANQTLFKNESKNDHDDNDDDYEQQHNYSLIDGTSSSDVFTTQYYCDDALLEEHDDDNGEEEDYDVGEDDTSYYSELTHEQTIKGEEEEEEEEKAKYLRKNRNTRPNSNKCLLNGKLKPHNRLKIKLHDLITMPEEYDDYETSIETSRLSDQDLFNMTSTHK